MLDLFGTPGERTTPAAASTEKNISEKNLSNTPRQAPPPKNFQASVGNSDQLVDSPQIHFDLCNSLQGSETPASESEILIKGTETPKEDAKPASKGKGTKKRVKRVSAMVKPPTEEELIAEGCVVEAEDDPRRTDKWRAEWSPRAKHPGKKGWHANINAIHLLESKVQTPKPDVISWKDRQITKSNIPWAEAEPDILKFVAAGGTISAYCQATGLSYIAATNHVKRTPAFKAQVAEARQAGADALAAEALRIASTPCMTEERITVYDKNDEVVTKSVKLADNTYARKLAFQARMQLLEKWAPDKYGPNAKAEISGGMAEKLRAARERIRSDLRASRRSSKAAPSDKSQS